MKKVNFYFLILAVTIIFCSCDKMPITSLTEKSSATESGTVVQTDNNDLNRRILSGDKKVWIFEGEDITHGINFLNDGSFRWVTIKKNGQKNEFGGKYKISGTDLIFDVCQEDGGESIIYHFSLENVARLYLGEGEDRSHFYLYGSIEDPHLNEPKNTDQYEAHEINNNNNNYLPTPNWNPTDLQYQYDNTPKRVTCTCCYGTGVCHICDGKGTIGTIPPSTCPACFGSGVCKYCHGTGILEN